MWMPIIDDTRLCAIHVCHCSQSQAGCEGGARQNTYTLVDVRPHKTVQLQDAVDLFWLFRVFYSVAALVTAICIYLKV